MNKDKIVEELNKYFKNLDPDFSVTNFKDKDLELRYDGNVQAWFWGFNREDFEFSVNHELCELFIKKGYLNKFYNKAVELMDKYGAKYTVHVIPGEWGFLYKQGGDISRLDFNNLDPLFYHRKNGYFTKSEIEELKKRDDVAIDWDKAIIKEVTD